MARKSGSSKSRTGGQHSFAQIPHANIQRSSFNRSCGLKTTFDAGYLVPIFVDEALPGDTMSLRQTTFARLATPLHPIMDNMYIDTHYFAVPIRLIWENWAKFNGEQTNPDDSTDFLVPMMEAPGAGSPGGHKNGSLSDYLGIPTEIVQLAHSSLWHRAYNLIYNEWFRDENMQDARIVPMDDGPDLTTDFTLQRRGKRHDYFTSCLPWPQKGPSVELPLGTSAPIVGSGWPMPLVGAYPSFNSPSETEVTLQVTTGGDIKTDPAPLPGDDTGALIWDNNGLVINFANPMNDAVADLTNATSATINAIREAFQVQRLYERDARGGTRYTEIIRSHFGVTSPDQRLQRPEFLGGGSTPINIHPVAQTAEGDFTTLGSLAAFGTASHQGGGFTKSFVEHCVILGFASVRADLNYQQGLNRMFSRRTRWDFFWPALANLGEQAVLNKEIYAQNDANDELVFGYQERFAEYRYKPSQITGQMRSNYASSLDTWHLAQDFDELPFLGNDFIRENPPIDRVVAVPSEPDILLDCFFTYKSVRPMPTYGVPGMIDHF